jgi:hypothetical protein
LLMSRPLNIIWILAGKKLDHSQKIRKRRFF